MTEKTAARRDNLRTRLIDAAEARVAMSGLAALKARDLAGDAGCAVGAIYNVFDDMTDLAMAVNGRTFRRLGAAVATSLEDTAPQDPADALVIMGRAYLRFASDNTPSWRALFDLEMSTDHHVPEWYMVELGALFALISTTLRDLRPDLSDEDIALTTRALFSSIHGIVLLGLEKRISGVPTDQMDRMITLTLQSFARTAE